MPKPPRRDLRAALVLAVVGALLVGACLPGAAGSPLPSGATSAAPSAPPSFVRPTPTPQPTFLTYVVRTGDSLSSIARVNRTTPRSIAFWNRAAYPSLDPESAAYEPDRIGVGWRLILIPGVVVDESALPSASRGSPSAGTSGPGETPAVGGASTVLTHGPRASAAVALTFDLGGRLDGAVELLDWLVAHDVHATVFPTAAASTTTDPGRAVLARLRAHADLFEVGNHSWDDPDFTTLSDAQIADQLTRAEAAIAPAVGRSTTPWFRPPFGAWNDAVRAAVGAAGWRYVVTWDVDTGDGDPTSEGGPTADDIEARVLSRVSGGSIVLLHLDGYHTLEALPAVVDGLRARGLTPVMLSALIGR